MWDFLSSEEIDKRPTIVALSAKVQVLEAENETLKSFLKETSEKETKEKKELSEKHSREMAELAEKLKKSHHRVTTLAAKNKSQEAEAEAIDKMNFRKYPFCYCFNSGFLKIVFVRGRNSSFLLCSKPWLRMDQRVNPQKD